MSDRKPQGGAGADTAAAIRLMAIKAAIFIGIPIVASIIAVIVYL